MSETYETLLQKTEWQTQHEDISQPIPFRDLPEHSAYKVLSMKKLKTKFGFSHLAEVETYYGEPVKTYKVWLPSSIEKRILKCKIIVDTPWLIIKPTGCLKNLPDGRKYYDYRLLQISN